MRILQKRLTTSNHLFNGINCSKGPSTTTQINTLADANYRKCDVTFVSPIRRASTVVQIMSEAGEPSKRNWKILDKPLGDRWPFFTGDFSKLNELLADKPSNSLWLILQFLNALLRSFGQVIFANNPISGVLIMLGIGIADYLALLAGIYTSTVSFIIALLFRQDSHAILNGGYGFNPVLHGVVSIGVLPSMYPEIQEFPPKFWLFLLITTILSVYVTSAFNNLFKHVNQYPIPCFTLPYNLLQFMLIYCLLHNTMPEGILSDHLLQAPSLRLNQTFFEANITEEIPKAAQNNTVAVNVSEHLNWGETYSGTIVAITQIYGLNNVVCAVLMYLALFIYSPTMTGFAYAGSLMGTLLGVLFANSHQEIYTGVWGYNALLCAASLGGFCFVLNIQSTLLAFTSVIFTTALQHFILPLFINMNFPILTMPFNLTVMLFLLITTEKEDSLSRPKSLTFPENHRVQYKNTPKRHFQGYLRRSYDAREEKEDIC